jgi:enterochelin esterase-like enzyme
MANMRAQVERTEQLLRKAGNENILLAEELRLKSEQLKVIENTYDDERAQTLQQNRCLQEQLDLAKTKYDVVHFKLDKSVRVIYKQESSI